MHGKTFARVVKLVPIYSIKEFRKEKALQNYILKGVVLRAIDWKEKDKLVTILTPEKGLLTINLRGVRQQKSKMKFATQPMCFAEFSLSGAGDILTCTGASEIESFFSITNNYDDMVLAGAVLEMTLFVATKEPSLELFVLLVRTLGALCDCAINHDVVFTKFCLELFSISGYKMNFDVCKTCGQKLTTANLNLHSGELVCDNCLTPSCVLVSLQVLKTLQFVNNFSFDDLVKLKITPQQAQDSKILMIKNFNHLFDKRLKSITIKA